MKKGKSEVVTLQSGTEEKDMEDQGSNEQEAEVEEEPHFIIGGK